MSSTNIKEDENRKSFTSGGTQSSSKYETPWEKFMHRNTYGILTFLGLVLGTLLGFSLRYTFAYSESYWDDRRLAYLTFPGEMFYSTLFCLKLPLTVFCIAAAIGSMNLTTFKFAIWRVFAYILLSTILAAFFGGIVAIVMHPGHKKDHPIHAICYVPQDAELYDSRFGNASCSKDHHPCYSNAYSPNVWKTFQDLKRFKNLKVYSETFCGDTYRKETCIVHGDAFLDLLESFFPDNIISTMLFSNKRRPNFALPDDGNSFSFDCFNYILQDPPKPTPKEYDVTFDVEKETNFKGAFVFIGVMAIAALCLEESGTGRPLLNVFTSLSECLLTMETWVLWLSLMGIVSYTAGDILSEDMLGLPSSVYAYIWTSVAALLLHSFVVLPFVYKILTRKSPFRLYKRLLPVIGVSFSTSSGSCSMPVVIMILEKVCHLDPRIVRLMIPLGAELNLNGAAVGTAVPTIYLAQLHGIEIDSCALLSTVFFTTLNLLQTSSNTTVRNFMHLRIRRVLQVLEMPAEFSVYVANVEWFLDHFQTMTSVLTNCVGAAIVDHYCSRQLEIMRLQEESKAATAFDKYNFGERETFEKENDIILTDIPYTPTSNPPLEQVKYTKGEKIQNQRKENTAMLGTQFQIRPPLRLRPQISRQNVKESKVSAFIVASPTRAKSKRKKHTIPVRHFKSNQSSISSKSKEKGGLIGVKRRTVGSAMNATKKFSGLSSSQKKRKKINKTKVHSNTSTKTSPALSVDSNEDVMSD